MNEIPPIIPLSQPAPRRRTGILVFAVVASVFLTLSFLLNAALLTLLFSSRGDGFTIRRYGYEEHFLQGDEDTKNKIAVIYLTGVISSVKDGYTSEEGMVGDIKDQLAQAVDDKNVKAIILRINSPGGEVVASDEIYQAILHARESKKPIIASMDTLAASGAFYAAMGCDYIVANELTLTGSIGVIMESFSVNGLMDKVGVKSYTFKSGKYKDILNPTREPTEDEKAMIQSMIMEVYEKFVGIVADARHLNVNELKTGIADGRVISGKQAQKAGLVDELGYFDDAVDAAMEHAKIKKAKIVTYSAPFSFRNLFRLLGSNDRTKIQIQLTPNTLKLETGKLYFLPAHMFQ